MQSSAYFLLFLVFFKNTHKNTLLCDHPTFLICYFLVCFFVWGHAGCLSVSVCLSVCPSIASHISETRQAITIKFDKVTASVTRMYHVLTIFTLTFIQGHTDLNHENSKCLIISETVQAMPIKFAVKLVQLKVYIIFSQ